MPTEENNWPYIEEGDEEYPASHTSQVDAIDESVAGVEGAVDGQVIQSSLDGLVVPVAPGVGVVDAIDPAETETPVQDAIDAVKAVGETGIGYGGATGGAGGILYPPGRISTPGEITDAGGIRHIGAGMPSTEIQLTDSTADLFSVAGKKDLAYSYWDQLTFFGGSGGTRSSGSAFHLTADEGGIPSFNIGAVGFHMWGSAPVIHFDGADAYGSTWGHLFSKGDGHQGPFFKANNCTVYALSVGSMHPGPLDPTAYALDCVDAEMAAHIDVVNSGSSAGRLLRHTGSGRAEGVEISWANSEPNGGDETPIDHAVYLGGLATTTIHHLTLTPRMQVENVIVLGNGPLGNGPANKNIGNVRAGARTNDALGNAYIYLESEPQETSWYWGPASDIDYNGFAESGVIPMADLRPPAPVAALAASGSTTLSSGAGTADTGVATDSGHYDKSINPGAAHVDASLDGSGTTYTIHFAEQSTAVGNPTVTWQLLESQL